MVYLCINLIKYCLYCRQKTRSRSKSRKKENDRPKHKIIMKDKESSDGTINKKKDSSVHQKTSKKSGTQCPCLLSAPDKIHLICKHCGNVDHATCYDILTTGDFKHTCGPCSVKLNLPCTSERMSNFYRKGVYQKEACKQMSRKLTRQRVLISYADKDYEKFIGIGDCFEKFLTTKFRIHETQAADILANLVYNDFLSKKDGITVNTEKIRLEYGYTPVHLTGIKAKDPVVPKSLIQQETHFQDKVQGEVFVEDQGNVSVEAKRNVKTILSGPNPIIHAPTLEDSGYAESTPVKNATEDPTFVPPKDADGNKSFIERRESASAGVSDEVYPGRGPKVDQKTGNVYTEHLIFPENHINEKSEIVGVQGCDLIKQGINPPMFGEIYEKGTVNSNNGGGGGFNCRMVLAKNGKFVNLVCFSESRETLSNYVKNIDVGKHYLIKKCQNNGEARYPQQVMEYGMEYHTCSHGPIF